MMWQPNICYSCYSNGVLFCPLMVRQHDIGECRFDSKIFQQDFKKTCKKISFCMPKLWWQVQAQCLFSNMILQFINIFFFSSWMCRRIFQATHALAPLSLAPTSFDTTSTLTILHFELHCHFSLFLEDYELDQDLELFSDSFKLTFQPMSHLSTSGPFGMIFEHLRDCFHPKNSVVGFFQWFHFYFHIAHDHISLRITHVFGVACLLAMTKLSGGVCPIVVGKTLY